MHFFLTHFTWCLSLFWTVFFLVLLVCSLILSQGFYFSFCSLYRRDIHIIVYIYYIQYTYTQLCASVHGLCVLQHQQQWRQMHKPRAPHTVARLIKIPRAPAELVAREYYYYTDIGTGEGYNHCCLCGPTRTTAIIPTHRSNRTDTNYTQY